MLEKLLLSRIDRRKERHDRDAEESSGRSTGDDGMAWSQKIGNRALEADVGSVLMAVYRRVRSHNKRAMSLDLRQESEKRAGSKIYGQDPF